MTIEYTIDENDFLTHQLFIASKSERIKRKRQRNKLILPLIYFIVGFLYFNLNNISSAIIFCVVGILWFFLYPIYEKRHYLNHYKGFIKENYKDRFDKMASLELTNDYILGKDKGGESKVLTTEIEEIIELLSIILVKLKGGQAFIIPKDKITNIDNVVTKLQELANHLIINYIKDEKWVWK